MTRIVVNINQESENWQIERFVKRIAAIVSGSNIASRLSDYSWSIDSQHNNWWLKVDGDCMVITCRQDLSIEFQVALRICFIHFCMLDHFNPKVGLQL